MGYGKTAKTIRIAKGMTQKQVAGDFLSKSFLSKFENDETDISLQRFVYVINRLMVSYDEFMYINRGFKADEYIDTMGKVIEAVADENIPLLQRILANQKALVTTNNSPYIENNIAIVSLNIERIRKEVYSKELVEQVTDYLFDINQWGLYEIGLFNNVMFALPSGMISELLGEIMKRGSAYFEFNRFKNTIATLFCNAIDIQIENCDYFEARKTLNLSTLIRVDDGLSVINTNIMLFGCILDYFESGKKESYLGKARKIIEACTLLGDNHLALQLERYLEKSINK